MKRKDLGFGRTNVDRGIWSIKEHANFVTGSSAHRADYIVLGYAQEWKYARFWLMLVVGRWLLAIIGP